MKPKETSKELMLPIENDKKEIGLTKKSGKRMKSCIKKQSNRNSENKSKKQLKMEQLQQQQMISVRVNNTCFQQMHLVMMDSSQTPTTQRRMATSKLSTAWYCHQSFPS